MSVDFRCIGWKKNKPVAYNGWAKAVDVSGNGFSGIFLRLPEGTEFIPASDFCDLIRYFIENYDLQKGDPRLKLLADLKNFRKVKGYNGPKTRRVEI